MLNLETAIEEKINAIETEMKRIALWQNEPLPKSAYDFNGAFGADKMSLGQWLQFVFIPRVRELLKTNGPWPVVSEVGTYAAQQFLFFQASKDEPGTYTTQGSPERKEAKLVQLLRDFDSLFTGPL